VDDAWRAGAAAMESALPKDLLALYALGAVEAALPLVAQVQWLNDHAVGQAQQLRVFALGYALFSLRPVYGSLADALASRYQRGRAVAYVGASLCGALCHGMLALSGSVTVFAAAYALLCACQACAETCLGARLADIVAAGMGAGRAQAQATAARWLGTLLAAGAGAILYRCDQTIPSPSVAFLAAAACPLVGSLVALTAAKQKPLTSERDAPSTLPLLVLVQLVCAWVSARGALSPGTWWISGGVLLVVVVAALLVSRHKTTPLEEPLLATKPTLTRWGAGPFLVAVAAVPSAAEVLANARYARFSGKPCVLPLVQALGAAAAMLVCLVCVHRPPASHRAAAGAVVIAAVTTLAQLPVARSVAAAMIGNAVDGADGAFLGVAATTMALRAAAGSDRRGAVYGAYLAAYDAGGAASGWLAVALATACRTESSDPASVRRYLYVAAAAALLPLVFLPLAPGPPPAIKDFESSESSDDEVSVVL